MQVYNLFVSINHDVDNDVIDDDDDHHVCGKNLIKPSSSKENQLPPPLRPFFP